VNRFGRKLWACPTTADRRDGRRRATRICSGLALVPALALTGPVGGVTASNVAAAAAPASAPTPAKSFGVSVPGLPTNLTALHAFEAMVGRKVSAGSYYQDFASGPNFDARSATTIWNEGTTPMLAWQPEDGRGPVTNQPAYSLATIIAGKHDTLITRWAREIAAWKKPFLLRFAPEMNGDWTPWSEGVNGNRPGQYVRAWRHVHDIFVRAGATNVIWLWDPMVNFAGSTPLAGLYPGNSYVDLVGLDGYNWGTSQNWSVWQSPAQVFAATVAVVQKITARPILLCEVASSERGGSKAAWISAFFAYLARTPAIRGFVWFEFNKETDWRVESSGPAERAFLAGLVTGNYR
jgi:hypothetical protein